MMFRIYPFPKGSIGKMNYKFMRILVFFDLPVTSNKNKRDYSAFRKFLIRNGFIMMQQSVYSKLVINNVTSAAIKQKVRSNLPPEGSVQLLEITENQFARIEYLSGTAQSLILDSTDRLVEL